MSMLQSFYRLILCEYTRYLAWNDSSPGRPATVLNGKTVLPLGPPPWNLSETLQQSEPGLA